MTNWHVRLRHHIVTQCTVARAGRLDEGAEDNETRLLLGGELTQARHRGDDHRLPKMF